MKRVLACVLLCAAGCEGADGTDGTNGVDGTNANVIAGDGITKTGDTVAVDTTVVRQSTAGDVSITGSYKYAAPRATVLAVPAAAFRPRNPGSSLADYNGGFSVSVTGGITEELMAPLTLPQGAHVTALRCQVRDDDAAADHAGAIALLTVAMANGAVAAAISNNVTSTGTPAVVFVDSTVTPFDIDNATTYYVLKYTYTVSATPTGTTSLQFTGCKLTYEINGPS